MTAHSKIKDMTYLQKQVHKTITGRAKFNFSLFTVKSFKRLLILDYEVAKFKDLYLK
jgi:hypothetical protein